MTTSTPPVDAAACVVVHAVGPDGFDQRCTLSAEDALVVGASPACGIRLVGADVAAMHCTISYEQGQLVVEDWDTVGGTYVDGERIARRVVVGTGITLTIGAYRIETSVLSREADVCAEATPPPPLVDAPCEAAPAEDALATAAPPQVAPPAVAPEVEAERPVDSAACDLAEDDAGLYDDVWDSPVAETADVFDATDAISAYAATSGIADDETLELLKIEVEYLRTELAERDARTGEFERSAGSTSDDDLPSRDEVEALASRLESLLAELDHSDERLKTMDELLRASEDANAAAEEERSQMESWIGEVERRVRQWESEWHAERDSLTKRIAELTADRDAAEAQGESRGSVQLIQELRDRIAEQERRSAELQAERDEALKRVETAQVESLEDRVAAEVEAALREERLLISQAKAECARERAKLVQLQNEMASQQTTSDSEPDVADMRIRAFREHLKEIRANEPDSRPAPPSMSQRMAKLWRKIEGRPLDTD